MYQRQLIKLRNVLLQWEGHQRRDLHQHRGVQLQEGERWLWPEGGYLQEESWAGLLQHPWKGNFCLHFLENIFTFSFPPRTRSKSRCARLIFTADKFPDIHPFPVEQPREINDHCEKKSIQPRCDTEVRLVCKYEPVKSCREAKQYCHKVEKVVVKGVCDIKFVTIFANVILRNRNIFYSILFWGIWILNSLNLMVRTTKRFEIAHLLSHWNISEC